MWKKAVITVLLLSITSLAYADTYTDDYYDSTYTTGYQEIDAIREPVRIQGKSNYPKITQIEKKIYSKSYENEDIYQRLSRIEMSLYKKTFDSDDLSTRVDNISDRTLVSAMPGYLLNDISALEERNFQKVFQNDTPDNRIERLEYHLIGAIQDGNYKDRIYKLKTLNDQNNISEYFDANSNDFYTNNSTTYNHITPGGRGRRISTNTKQSKWDMVQQALFLVAPFLFCL